MLLPFAVILTPIVVKWKQVFSRDIVIPLNVAFNFFVALLKVSRLLDNMVVLLIPHHLFNLLLETPVKAVEAFEFALRTTYLVLKD